MLLSSTKPIHLSLSRLDRQGGILYQTSIFNTSELVQLRQDLSHYQRQMVEETKSSVAQNRLGVALPKDSVTCEIVRHGSLTEWVNDVAVPRRDRQEPPASTRYVLRDDMVPVELRSYEKPGACMAWHSDDVLFDPPQLEVVWTLENTSNCVTQWKPSTNNNNNNNVVATVETDVNAALLIQAGGPSHCVTSLRYGRRVILKCVYALPDATFCTVPVTQFASSKKRQSSKGKSSKGRRPVGKKRN